MVVPMPLRLSSSILPRCSLTISRQSPQPKPVPSRDRLVVKRGVPSLA